MANFEQIVKVLRENNIGDKEIGNLIGLEPIDIERRIFDAMNVIDRDSQKQTESNLKFINHVHGRNN